MWKCTGGPPNDVKPKSHVRKKVSFNLCDNGARLSPESSPDLAFRCDMKPLGQIPKIAEPMDSDWEREESVQRAPKCKPQAPKVGASPSQGIHAPPHFLYTRTRIPQTRHFSWLDSSRPHSRYTITTRNREPSTRNRNPKGQNR